MVRRRNITAKERLDFVYDCYWAIAKADFRRRYRQRFRSVTKIRKVRKPTKISGNERFPRVQYESVFYRGREGYFEERESPRPRDRDFYLEATRKVREKHNFSFSSYLRWKAILVRGNHSSGLGWRQYWPGLKKLDIGKTRRPSSKRTSKCVVRSVILYAQEHPSHGQKRAAESLSAQGVLISASGVRSIWKRHDLETKEKRRLAIG